MAVIPGNSELDLKSVSCRFRRSQNSTSPSKRVAGAHRIYPGRGNCIAGKKDYPVYVDESIQLFDRISVSAGIRGMQILVAPADYLKIMKATLAQLAHPKR
jgi:Cys-tRNA(Pro)/Cys-tRNA(Cys) deacylase